MNKNLSILCNTKGKSASKVHGFTKLNLTLQNPVIKVYTVGYNIQYLRSAHTLNIFLSSMGIKNKQELFLYTELNDCLFFFYNCGVTCLLRGS